MSVGPSLCLHWKRHALHLSTHVDAVLLGLCTDGTRDVPSVRRRLAGPRERSSEARDVYDPITHVSAVRVRVAQ